MAKIAVLPIAGAGHLYPSGTVAYELQRRGHDVVVITFERARPILEKFELSMHALPNPGERNGSEPVVERLVTNCLSVIPGLRHVARIRRTSSRMISHVPGILRDLQTDLVVADGNVLCGGTIAERLKIPCVTIFSGLPSLQENGQPPGYTCWSYSTHRWALLRNWFGNTVSALSFEPVRWAINRKRRTLGLPLIRKYRDFMSTSAQITQLIPELDFPRQNLPEVCHYVGALATSRMADQVDFPWDCLDERPLVLASLGTVSSGFKRSAPRVFQAIAEACVGLDVQLLITLGKVNSGEAGREQWVERLPGNPLVLDYVPQLALLDRAKLLVTCGGHNTMLGAIRAGVPMVALPASADQPGNAARIQYAGIGLADSFYHPDPGRLREKIQRVLSDESFYKRIAVLREAEARAGGPARAADIVERVLETRAPVTRADMQAAADSK